MNVIAAYDFGTSGVKAALVTDSGEILAVKEKGYPLLRPAPGRVEQSPDDFWNAVCEVTHGVMEESGIAKEDVKGLNFSVQAVTLIPVSADGEVLYNAVSWLDGRAIKQAEEINERCGMGELVRPQDQQSRLLWFKEEEPEIYAKTAKFLECDGFLQWKATGVMAVPDDHPGVLKYAPEIEEFFKMTLDGIDPDKLPPMVEACKEFAKLDAKGAAELGLCEGTPVFGGMIDVPAAAAGAGCAADGDAHLYLGSSGWLTAMIDRPYECSDGTYQLASIDPEIMIYGGCLNCCCTFFNWAIDRFYAKEHEEMGGDIFGFIDSEVNSVAAGCDGLLATPWLFGEQFPISDPYIRTTFFNVTQDHTRAHFIASVMESICLSLRGQCEVYKKDIGKELTELAANGGGSLSPAWMQMMANVLQMKIKVPKATRHSGAIGAAFATTVGLGLKEMDQINEFVEFEHIYEPDTSLKEVYDKKYDAFMKLYAATKDLYKELNEVE